MHVPNAQQEKRAGCNRAGDEVSWLRNVMGCELGIKLAAGVS